VKIDTLQQIEVAEGVDILLRPAGPVPRLVALLLDFLAQMGLAVLAVLGVMLFAAIAGVRGAQVGAGVYLLVIFLVNWGYFTLQEAGKRGATLGKRAMGLKVVRTSGSPIGFGQSVLRNLLRVVDGLPFIPVAGRVVDLLPLAPLGLVGLCFVLLTKRFQRVGDLLADTVVVYARKSSEMEPLPLAPQVLAQVKVMPPPYSLTKEEQQAVVLFLERAGMWSDARKEELAGHAGALTGDQGRTAVLNLMGMGVWLRDS
jgi:uncharacterized RDD family membrane protein YckC